ncbi:psbQ-like protein 3, chloroplastic [Aristolochia californica]|uniref:psbQ-like protein 3, chloroplastic n=1 Tax=Aristolochia californica TaxID=171875 RepID=UPI0035DCBEAF
MKTAALATALLAKEALGNSTAAAFDFRITTPDQTLEEAVIGVKVHARELLGIKPLIELQSWGEVQKALRDSSAKLKQDIYTIINQGRPGSQRPLLRQLYSKLFNSVTRLDYAARSEDAGTVQECYDTIVESLDEIFSMI